MQPVKVNIFISHTPEDWQQLNKLLRWLYPMRDEVNIWYNKPPPPPPELSIPWQLLLFWYIPPDNRQKYQKIIKARREKAHIYLFLTSYKSLSDRNVEQDIEVAATRRIAGDDHIGPFVFPIILSPSRWKEESRLAGFAPMAGGTPLTAYKVEEDGYLAITEELAALLKVLQNRLGEAKFYNSRLEPSGNVQLKAGSSVGQPYLGESDEELAFQEIEPFQPPEWLGWAIILFLVISVLSTMTPKRLTIGRYDNIEDAEKKPLEYRRERPMMPPPDSIGFPPAD